MSDFPNSASSANLRSRRAVSATSHSQDTGLDGRSNRSAGRRGRMERDAGFAGYVSQLARILTLPVTLPVRISYRLLTSPSTISIGIKLFLFAILLAISAGFTALALAGFWVSGRGGGIVEVEGWFVYGSKTSPTPHAYIRLAQPEKLFSPGIGYDVDVELELVRPRLGSPEESGNFMLGVEFYSQSNGAVVASVQQPCLPAQPYIPPSLPERLVNAFTSPAIYFLRLPLSLNPTSLLYNPLSLLRSPSTIAKRRKRTKGSKDTFVLKRPVISSISRNGFLPLDGGEAFEGKGIVMRPDGRGKGGVVGALQVSVGREDGIARGEVKTTGWVVVRFTPRPTGLRYIFASHPLIPLLVVPPFALFATLSSATFSYFVISMFFSRPVQARPEKVHTSRHIQSQSSKKAEKSTVNVSGKTLTMEGLKQGDNGLPGADNVVTKADTPNSSRNLEVKRNEEGKSASETGTGTSSVASTTDGDSDGTVTH